MNNSNNIALNFITTNPFFVITVISCCIIYSIYLRSTYKIRDFRLSHFSNKLYEQIESFTKSLSESIIDLVIFSIHYNKCSPPNDEYCIANYAFNTDDTFDNIRDKLKLIDIIKNILKQENMLPNFDDDDNIIMNRKIHVEHLEKQLQKIFRFIRNKHHDTQNDKDRDKSREYMYTVYLFKILLLYFSDFEKMHISEDNIKKYDKKYVFIDNFNYNFSKANAIFHNYIYNIINDNNVYNKLNSILKLVDIQNKDTKNIYKWIDTDNTVINYLDELDNNDNTDNSVIDIYNNVNYFNYLTSNDIDVDTYLDPTTTDLTSSHVNDDKTRFYISVLKKCLESVHICIEQLVHSDYATDVNKKTENRKKLNIMNINIIRNHFDNPEITFQNKTTIEEVWTDSDLLDLLVNSELNKYKTNIFEMKYNFEKLLYAFQSNSGGGLLMIQVDTTKKYTINNTYIRYYSIFELIKEFNLIMTVNDLVKNSTVIKKAFDMYNNDVNTIVEKNDMFKTIANFYSALSNIQLHMTNEFPKLLYFDTCRNADVKRLTLYYDSYLQYYQDYIQKDIAKVITYLYDLFISRKIKVHKPLRIGVVDLIVENIYQKLRDFLHDTFDYYSKKVHEIFKWIVIENYKDYEPNNKYGVEGFKKSKYDENDIYDKEGAYIDEDGNVVEGMLGPLKGILISAILKPLTKYLVKPFVKTIMPPFAPFLKFIETLIDLLDFITNPIRVVTKFVTMLFKTYIAIVISVVCFFEKYFNIITSVLLIPFILFSCFNAFIYSIVMIIIVKIIMTIDIDYFNGIIFVELYRYILANEHEIDEWKSRTSYEIGNESERQSIIPVVCKPCKENYKPADLLCKRLPNYLPVFSHHANIFRILENKPVGLIAPGALEMDLKFMGLPVNERKRLIRKFDMNKQYYVKHSNDRMRQYDDKLRNICKYVEGNMQHKNEYDIDIIKSICVNKFCINGNYDNFCSKLSAAEAFKNIKNTTLFENYLFLLWYVGLIGMILIVVLYVYYNGQEQIQIMLTKISVFLEPFFKKSDSS